MTLSLYQAIERFRGDARTERNKILVQFCGVSLDTVSRWNEKRLPKGVTLLKLWYLLEAHGLIVQEISKLREEIRYFGRLVAFDVLTAEEVLIEIDLPLGSTDYLWRALQGKLLPLAIRKGDVTVKELSAKYDDRLAAAISDKAEQGLMPEPSTTQTQATRPSSGPRPVAPAQEPNPLHHVMAASFIGGLEPLVKQIVAEGEESIKALRTLLDDDTFYALLDGLKAMSTRRARQFYEGSRG